MRWIMKQTEKDFQRTDSYSFAYDCFPESQDCDAHFD